jgi:hypothetical protein
MAKNMPGDPKGTNLPLLITTACLTNPNPGRIRI